MPQTMRIPATRVRILRAAEQEFARAGFHAASVSAITKASSVAQGTFYIYFRSKDDIFRELVRDIGHQLRKRTGEAVAGLSDRLRADRAGLESFVGFLVEHPGLYRIVQEAQFVDASLFREYYVDIARGYAKSLSEAAAQGALRPGDAEVRAWAIMGIGHFLGLRYCLWQGHAPAAQDLDQVMDFIAHGIAPEPRA